MNGAFTLGTEEMGGDTLQSGSGLKQTPSGFNYRDVLLVLGACWIARFLFVMFLLLLAAGIRRLVWDFRVPPVRPDLAGVTTE